MGVVLSRQPRDFERAHGVLDDEGRILDGRNRYAVCKLGGIDPYFVIYEGWMPPLIFINFNDTRP